MSGVCLYAFTFVCVCMSLLYYVLHCVVWCGVCRCLGLCPQERSWEQCHSSVQSARTSSTDLFFSPARYTWCTAHTLHLHWVERSAKSFHVNPQLLDDDLME